MRSGRYLHLAGRTGRQPVLEGTVVTICPGQSHEVLLGWRTRLGGIAIRQLPLAGAGGEEARPEHEGSGAGVGESEAVEVASAS